MFETAVNTSTEPDFGQRSNARVQGVENDFHIYVKNVKFMGSHHHFPFRIDDYGFFYFPVLCQFMEQILPGIRHFSEIMPLPAVAMDDLPHSICKLIGQLFRCQIRLCDCHVESGSASPNVTKYWRILYLVAHDYYACHSEMPSLPRRRPPKRSEYSGPTTLLPLHNADACWVTLGWGPIHHVVTGERSSPRYAHITLNSMQHPPNKYLLCLPNS